MKKTKTRRRKRRTAMPTTMVTTRCHHRHHRHHPPVFPPLTFRVTSSSVRSSPPCSSPRSRSWAGTLEYVLAASFFFSSPATFLQFSLVELAVPCPPEEEDDRLQSSGAEIVARRSATTPPTSLLHRPSRCLWWITKKGDGSSHFCLEADHCHNGGGVGGGD